MSEKLVLEKRNFWDAIPMKYPPQKNIKLTLDVFFMCVLKIVLYGD